MGSANFSTSETISFLKDIGKTTNPMVEDSKNLGMDAHTKANSEKGRNKTPMGSINGLMEKNTVGSLETAIWMAREF